MTGRTYTEEQRWNGDLEVIRFFSFCAAVTAEPRGLVQIAESSDSVADGSGYGCLVIRLRDLQRGLRNPVACFRFLSFCSSSRL